MRLPCFAGKNQRLTGYDYRLCTGVQNVQIHSNEARRHFSINAAAKIQLYTVKPKGK